jgi:heme exporter protein CcmD
MSDKHFAFIFASYAITALVIGGLVIWSMLDYRRLRNAIDRLPRRDEDASS